MFCSQMVYSLDLLRTTSSVDALRTLFLYPLFPYVGRSSEITITVESCRVVCSVLSCRLIHISRHIFRVTFEFLPRLALSAMDLQLCAGICTEYPYYSLQYGVECWCGEYTADYDKYGESDDCDFDCSGSRSQNCGGRWAMSVYTQGA